MIIHIVHANETIYLIAEHYHVEVNDIMSINKHITDFMHLQPGMKIKIPLIGSEIIEELEESEPFIEDYYPEINENNIEEKDPEEEINDEENKEDESLGSNPEMEASKKEIRFPYYYYKDRGLPFKW